MTTKDFNTLVSKQMKLCKDVLCCKALEYATEDRLHNFKVAAQVQEISPKEALAGMMAKHTVSIYDMCSSVQPYTEEVWSEKITDHINYLILLKAVVEDERSDNPESERGII